jgi:hypothetical protein
MSPVLGAALLALLFGLVTLLTDALPRRWRYVPLVVLGLCLLLLFLELARYDHGQGDVLLWIGWIGAPGAILGCACAWIVRRFRRRPSVALDRQLRRATAMAVCVAAGVLAGWKTRTWDLERSEERGATLAKAFASAPPKDSWSTQRSHMGWWAPPRYWFGRDERGRQVLAFHLGAEGWRVLTLEEGSWRTVSEDPAVAVRGRPSGS